MATFQIADLEPLLPELVSNVATKGFEEDTSFYSKIGEGKGEPVNGRGRRVPYYGAANPSQNFFSESGAYATPGKEEFFEMKVFPTRFSGGVEWSGDVIDTWKTRDDVIDGVTDKLARKTSHLKKSLQRHLIYGDGTGTLGTVLSVSGSVITMASTYAAGSTMGATLLDKNQRVDVWTALGAQRTGTAVISSKTGTTITVDAVPTSTAATDVVVPEGSYNKAFHGLKHIINNDTGVFQGASRSTYPQLRSNVVDASGAAVSVALITKTKAQQRYLASEDAADIMLLSSIAQKNGYERQAFNLIRLGQGEKFNGALGNSEVGHAGSEWMDVTDCDADRIYGLNMKHIKKYELRPFGFFALDGQNFIRYASNGVAADKISGWLGLKVEFGSDNPQELFCIKNLSITDLPTGAALLAY